MFSLSGCIIGGYDVDSGMGVAAVTASEFLTIDSKVNRK